MIMKKRWISLYVENEVGVLAKIAGLFSGKSYNLMSLTVGTTEDSTMSRMTISVESDDATFEQIKKQLNRCVEVIEVIDFTNCPIHRKEVLYIKVKKCDEKIKNEVLRIAGIFHHSWFLSAYIPAKFKLPIVDYGKEEILLECMQTETRNDEMIAYFSQYFKNIEVVRGGSVAIQGVSIQDK